MIHRVEAARLQRPASPPRLTPQADDRGPGNQGQAVHSAPGSHGGAPAVRLNVAPPGITLEGSDRACSLPSSGRGAGTMNADDAAEGRVALGRRRDGRADPLEGLVGDAAGSDRGVAAEPAHDGQPVPRVELPDQHHLGPGARSRSTTTATACVCGEEHPRAIGRGLPRDAGPRRWPVIGEPFERALRGRDVVSSRTSGCSSTATATSRRRSSPSRFSPIRDESGGVGGLFHPVTETTATMLARAPHARAARPRQSHGRAAPIERGVRPAARDARRHRARPAVRAAVPARRPTERLLRLRGACGVGAGARPLAPVIAADWTSARGRSREALTRGRVARRR